MTSLGAPPLSLPPLLDLLSSWSRVLHVRHPAIDALGTTLVSQHDAAVHASRLRFAHARLRSLNLRLSGGPPTHRPNRHVTKTERLSRLAADANRKAALPLRLVQDLSHQRVRGSPASYAPSPGPLDVTPSQRRSITFNVVSVDPSPPSSFRPPLSLLPCLHTQLTHTSSAGPLPTSALGTPSSIVADAPLMLPSRVTAYCSVCQSSTAHGMCRLCAVLICTPCAVDSCSHCGATTPLPLSSSPVSPLSAMRHSVLSSRPVLRPALVVRCSTSSRTSPAVPPCMCPPMTLSSAIDHRPYFCPQCSSPCCLRTRRSYPSDNSVPGTPARHGPALSDCPRCSHSLVRNTSDPRLQLASWPPSASASVLPCPPLVAPPSSLFSSPPPAPLLSTPLATYPSPPSASSPSPCSPPGPASSPIPSAVLPLLPPPFASIF